MKIQNHKDSSSQLSSVNATNMRVLASLLTVFLPLLMFTTTTECQNAPLLPILQDFSQWLYNLIFGLLPVGVTIPPDIQAEMFMEPTERMALLGLTAENHTVSTSDGYNLNFYRISNTSSDAITVFLMHGLTSSSDTYLVALNYSIAFQLSQQGFDVWLGNWRGSPYSNHTTYTRQDKQFWDYSFEDMADKDLPTGIDYILNATGKGKLAYVGHSVGTIVGFCFFSSHPNYNSKVSSFTALSPVPNLRYSSMMGRLLFSTAEITMPLLETIGQYSFAVVNPDLVNILAHACSNSNNYELCELYISIIAGWNPYYHNQTRLPIFLARLISSGSSTKNFKHLSQIIRYNGLRHFDYGSSENQERYNSTIPPIFDLTTITVPTFLYYGPNDAPSNNVAVTYGLTGVNAAHYRVIYSKPMYCHYDPASGNNTPTVLMPDIISDIRNTY